MAEHDPADVEWMARVICVALDQDPNAWEHLRTPEEIDRALDHMQANGWKVTKKLAKRPMTLAAEHQGAGEAQAEDCWLVMHDAATLTPRD